MDRIKSIVEKQLNTAVVSIISVGKGASGSVYQVKLESEPYKLAVKIGKDFSLLSEEKEMLEFLLDKVAFKVPKPVFICSDGENTYLGLEFIEGESGKKIPIFCNKKKLSDSIVSAFENMQKVTNDKFGKYNKPQYDSWHQYYRDFFDGILAFSNEKYIGNELEEIVIKALKLVDESFDLIFGNISDTAVLCHGDFWLPNLMLDFKTGELKGVLDPFNMLWAEKEYELFCLTAGSDSRKLKLYENYKKRNTVSQFCDLKLEIYALCNELNWYKRLGTIGHDYLVYRSKNIINKAHFRVQK